MNKYRQQKKPTNDPSRVASYGRDPQPLGVRSIVTLLQRDDTTPLQ